MAALTISPAESSWSKALAGAIRTPAELLEAVGLGPEYLAGARQAAELFPLFTTHSYVARMRRGDPADPLLRQVLPLADETAIVPGFVADAVGDDAARRAPGLLHKYAGRALLIAAGACAIHCRYCFRRHYPYGEEPRRMADWEPALQEIAGDSSLEEIILSGGDPLMLTDRRLAELCDRLDAIPHLQRLRIHSRLPIVLPERVAEGLISLLKNLRMQPWMVVHANHPQELDGDCGETLRHLVRSGIPTLNQAVLLRGVNDDVATLTELSRRLVAIGVQPYYLHQLDRVAGTAHFEVPEEQGRELIARLREQLPGYAVPTYVRERPGDLHKLPL